MTTTKRELLKTNVADAFWNSVTDLVYEEVSKEHRRGSSFYVQNVYKIDRSNAPYNPEYHGLWLSNVFIWDSDYGSDGPVKLTRVNPKTVVETITRTTWEPVKETQRDVIINKLKNGVYNVRFIKTDGSERQALATLLESVIEAASGTGKKSVSSVRRNNNDNEQVVSFFSLKDCDWRSFRIDRLKSIEKVSD